MDHTESPAGDPLILPHSLLHLGPLQVEWGKSLCTRTDSTCEASWAASLTSHCPLITTFPLWRTLRMGKTSTLAGLSNTRWPCPRDTASIWNPRGPETLPDAAQRSGDRVCFLSPRTKYAVVGTKAGGPGWPSLQMLCGPNPMDYCG